MVLNLHKTIAIKGYLKEPVYPLKRVAINHYTSITTLPSALPLPR